MNNIRCILLAFSLFVPMVVTYYGLQRQRTAVREAVKEKLLTGVKADCLTVLKFSTTTRLDWKDDREFKYQGELYDVVKYEVSGDSVYYYCWPDRAETELDRKINALLAGELAHDSARTDSQEQLINFYKNFYWSTTSTWLLQPPAILKKPMEFRVICRVKDHHTLPSVPPPELG